MALVINDRVKETTTTTGTGAVSLAGAVSGFETFAAGIGNSNTVYYCIAHQDQAEFEVGLGTLDGDSSDLTRTTVISSSNSDSAVNFSSGTKDVFCTLPASKLIFEDGSNNVTFGGAITGVTNLTASGELDAATLDISGDADIDGTLEADAITLNGTALSSIFASLSGATFTGNIEIDVASGDPAIILDTQGADKFHFAVDDSDSDNLVIKSGGTVGSGNGLKLDSSGNLTVTADVSVGDDLTVEGGVIALKNTGAQSELRLYCESSNAHYAALKAPAHADFSGNTALTLPATTDTIVARATTDTLTNKSIDSDNNTITNIVNADIKSSAAIADSKLATISTAGKVALTALEIDGGSDIGADLTTSDLIIVDDGAGGTNRKAALSRVVTLMSAQGFSQEDPTALAIALG
tara:strand:- start:379 stop:1605 length:1227 start_codon:yes stop_codon:yes gene_type:complete